MEYSRDLVKMEHHDDYWEDRVPVEHFGYGWQDSASPWEARQAYNWAPGARFQSPEYCMGSPKTPPVGKYITIQPRSTDTSFRDQRMLLPVTQKRRGNNRYGQSGSQRCARCQKGKRKCIYSNKNDPCQRCIERGFTDCGEKLPTPRKQAALRQLQESGYLLRDTDNYPSRQSSSDDYSSQRSSGEYHQAILKLPELPNVDSPRQWARGNPQDEALYKLWKNLAI